MAGCLFCLLPCPGLADRDTELRLNQEPELSAEQREQRLQQEETFGDLPLPDLIINGQKYPVRNNRDDLGRALYLALRSRNLTAALRFLEAYRALDNPDPMLLHYARGKLARWRGELEMAEAEFRALLALKPDFLPGRLELARVLFENHENQEAQQGFRDIRDSLPAEDPRAAGVRSMVTAFLDAIDERSSWQGRLALGPAYSDNVNLSSGSASCLVMFSNGACFISRSVPEAIETRGLAFEGVAEKTFFLSGHHGWFLRALAYGDRYRDYGSYNQDTFSASAGYRFRDANDVYSLAQLLEYARYGDDRLYDAWGGRFEWVHYLSSGTAFRLEASHKRMHYRETYSRFDGDMNSLYVTGWQGLGSGWSLFAGLDGVDRNTGEPVSSYNQYGLRLGLGGPLWKGVDLTLLASVHNKRYDVYSALLGERREDLEQRYTANVGFRRWTLAGVTPGLKLEHTRVKSNVDWLYSYRKNVASLMFEWRF